MTSSIALGRRCGERSSSVRATVVVGISSVSVHSQARKVPTRWSLIRVRSGARPADDGFMTWMTRPRDAINPQCAAASQWLSTAVFPHARTAARHRPSRVSSGWPIA
jgi:hypothetical protein